MCKILLLTVMILSLKNIYAQAPEIEWQNTIGGSATDNLYSIALTHDGGYILGGSSGSNIFADKTEANIGSLDYWVVKLDSLGNIQWQKTIGGTETDDLSVIKSTKDGGYIAGGWSNSGVSGNKTEVNIGNYDFWVVKLDSSGNIQWQNTIGGTSYDKLYDLVETECGGFTLAGVSNSEISGDKTEAPKGGYDYWLIALDSTGDIEWQKTIGGDNHDILYSILLTNYGYLLAGTSISDISGDKTKPTILRPDGLPSLDQWIIEIDTIGNILSQDVIGGNLDDDVNDLEKNSNGGAVLGGGSTSGISEDKNEENYGSNDYWIVSTNIAGEIIWQKTIGGSSSDLFQDGTSTFYNGFTAIGSSISGVGGNKALPNIGYTDFWVVSLDSIGNILWQKVLGGSEEEIPCCVLKTPDGGYIIGGWSGSNISDTKAENNIGSEDYWVLKLASDDTCTPNIFYADADGDGFGNTDFTILSCDTPAMYVLNNLDCNDLNAEIYLSALEICNEVDDNCNGEIDDAIPYFNFYADIDNDGYGNVDIDTLSCLPFISGYVADSTDCNDFNNKIHDPIIYYADTDHDLYGDSLNDILACTFISPEGFVSNNLDCDDSNYFINPGSNEIENGLDDNCNDTIDEGYNAIDNLLSTNFILFPNPNDGEFIITFNEINVIPLTVEIYNSLGKKIYHENFNPAKSFHIVLPKSFSGLGNMMIKTDHEMIRKTICVLQ